MPADGFYEWKREGGGKQSYAIALSCGSPMGLAGLWESWQAPDGSWILFHDRHDGGERAPA